MRSEELYSLYASPDIIRVRRHRNMKLAEYIASVGNMRKSH